MGSKGVPMRKVRTRFKSHWGITKGVGGNILSPLRNLITIGDLNKEG